MQLIDVPSFFHDLSSNFQNIYSIHFFFLYFGHFFRVEKAYDEFQLKLGLDELEQSYDLNVTNSNASLATWQKSSKNHNNTPTMPKSTTKRKRHEVNVMSDIDSTTKRAKFGEDDDEHKTIEGGDSFDDFDDVMMKEDEITEKETTNDENNYVKSKYHCTRIPFSCKSLFFRKLVHLNYNFIDFTLINHLRIP